MAAIMASVAYIISGPFPDEGWTRTRAILSAPGWFLFTVPLAYLTTVWSFLLGGIDSEAYDEEIDEQEKTVESLCMKLLLQQQPVAKDLRLISAALKMITDMERIGDHAGAQHVING